MQRRVTQRDVRVFKRVQVRREVYFYQLEMNFKSPAYESYKSHLFTI